MPGTAADNRDLEHALAAVRRPIGAPAMPPAGLRVRLTTTSWLRRLLPRRVAVVLARARAEARWRRNRPARAEALATMQTIVAGTAREHEAQALARERLIEQQIERTLFWHPWQTARMDDASATNARRALESGRGVLVSTCHLGPTFLHLSVITRGRRGFIVSAPWWFEQPTRDHWGRRLARWRQRVQARGDRSVCSTGAYPVLRALLRERELVVLYFDMPGGRRTLFLGKPVMLAGSSARLACESDALVLPVRARRAGHLAWTDVAAPLDPREFSTHEQLHDALAAAHERFILELPATLEDPNRAGAWEGTATPTGWSRPASPASPDTGGAPPAEPPPSG